MNPPSALHSAMSRDRKPFTYTPGGLDLSEIKSQRMAQRLMRNAMNPGVPEVSPILPSSIPTSTPVALPNFNCLPVQVFPAMPANPKTLLRSRSNPDPRQAPLQRLNPPAFVNNMTSENRGEHLYENKPMYSQQLNNNRPISMYEYTTKSTDELNASRQNFEGNGYTGVNAAMPAFTYSPMSTTIPESKPMPVYNSEARSTSLLSDNNYEAEISRTLKKYDESINEKLPESESVVIRDNVSNNVNISNNTDLQANIVKDAFVDIDAAQTVEENININNEQKEVKIIKKQVIKEKKVEEQNGNQNGDTNDEANMTIKLPTKKSGAKTETKVEVEKKVLPDGTIEEIKTTTTTTTIDGRTEIKTKTEKKTIPKEEEYEEEVEEEEEEEEVEEEGVKEGTEEVSNEPEIITVTKTIDKPKENGNILKTEEKSETTVVKKAVIIQQSEPEQSEVAEEEVEDSEVEEGEEVTVVIKKQASPEPNVESKSTTEEVTEEKEEVEKGEEEMVPINIEPDQDKDEEELKSVKQEVDQEEVEKERAEEIVEDEIQKNVEEEISEKPKLRPSQDDEQEQEDEEEYEEAEEEKQDLTANEKTKDITIEEHQVKETIEGVEKKNSNLEKSEERIEQSSEVEEHVIPIQIAPSEDQKSESKQETPKEKTPEFKIPIREPSIPLDKVEDVEIKPIGITPIISKTHTENTEIITSNIDPSGGLSKQTEYNKIENIVTINRTTKILDQNYENLTQQGIPIVKTYFAPPNIDRISISSTPSRGYQPVYTPESTSERRHSLLLERLSMERQMPTDIYQYSHQSHEQTQYQDEPQSEVLTVSNVKPSSITNQQWYQQNKQTQNVLYNNVTSTSTPVGCPWAQPKSPQPQQQYQPQPQYNPPPQPQYQTQYQAPQPQFQQSTTPQPQFQRGSTPQPQVQKPAASQPQYQPAYSEPNRDRIPPKSYTAYTPSTWLGSSVDSASNQYSYASKDTTQNYEKSTFNSTSQQYSSQYVPPPWEQDSNYTSVNNTSETFYREIPQTNTFSPTPSQGWRVAPSPAKFTKSSPIAYVPPAPNQSFVKTGSKVEPPRLPGRKTYYSEYERRYITVPESTYIPTETKFQPQPDPSPQYYYDNNEPTENVEPQWRRELREFTEKTSQTTEQTNIQPPWEVDSKYSKTATSTYTPTPTWSQTLRPQSYRKRSFESEFVSQEWPKANTLGRGRPLSGTVGKSFDNVIPERARGVSVDRYNPNNYQPPAEHPPVQSHTLTTPLPHAGHHNPNVPAYHARASAEPREQPPATTYQQRVYREARASPLQSRSFKYLQWITGTEN